MFLLLFVAVPLTWACPGQIGDPGPPGPPGHGLSIRQYQESLIQLLSEKSYYEKLRYLDDLKRSIEWTCEHLGYETTRDEKQWLDVRLPTGLITVDRIEHPVNAAVLREFITWIEQHPDNSSVGEIGRPGPPGPQGIPGYPEENAKVLLLVRYLQTDAVLDCKEEIGALCEYYGYETMRDEEGTLVAIRLPTGVIRLADIGQPEATAVLKAFVDSFQRE